MAGTPLARTALFDLHKSLGARIVTYAGYEMPIQYKLGVLKEHHHTRSAAGLFDVSHMGQLRFTGKDRERFLEWVTPADVQALKNSQARLSILTNAEGGIKDDLIISKYEDHSYVVINAGCKQKDIAHFREKMAEFKGDVQLEVLEQQSLLALQGPLAMRELEKYVDGLKSLPFMSGIHATIKGVPVRVTRCGYTGEDGFEISMPSANAIPMAQMFLENPEVQFIGLAARDSLRLEAGMCLYTHELDESVNPVAARLMWVITKRRQEGGGYIGHEAITNFKNNAATLVPRLRGGVISTGAVAREGTEIAVDGKIVGKVTSGCPSPTLGKNVAQCYLDRDISKGAKVQLMIRGKPVDGEVVNLPFTTPRYYKL